MNVQKLRTYVEIFALLMVSAAAVLFGLKTATELLSSKEQPAEDVSQRYRAGDRAPSIPGVDYGAKDKTVVFALSTRCRFCEENGPFYRETIEASRRSGRFQVVFAFSQENSDGSAFLDRIGLSGLASQFHVTSRVDFGRIGIRATPTTIVVGRDGMIRRAKVGMVGTDESVALIRDLQGTGAGA